MMAHEGSEPADLEAQRRELEAVLRSDHFSRAPMLAHLLTYLCEKLLAGKAHQVKEYSIGVELFHRGDGFDPNSDSIVRVEANRLRKRLAAYYAGDGAAHRLRITIPLGQYVPQFTTVAAPGEGKNSPTNANSSAAAQPRVESAAVPRAKWGIDLSGRGIWWGIAALGLLLLGPVYAVLIFRQMKQPSQAEVSNQAASPLFESQFGPPVGEEVRILAGSSRGFVDNADKLWKADAWFEGGTAVKGSVEQILRTQNPVFYRTSRQGQFSYAIPLKKGVYELRLHFAETVYGLDATGAGGEGRRIMTVGANGRTLLSRFDIVADAGASLTADVKVFPGITPAADGLLHLDFTGEDGKQATLSAIEIVPGFRTHMRPVRILARPTPYYSNDSHWWSPDDYFEGGQWASYTTPVRGTDDPELYETERWGNFSYAIPVSPGSYSLTLLFAARHADWDQPSSPSADDRAPVAHVFNLFCNGVALLKNFNLAEEARGTDVVKRRFTGLEPNAQGKLLLSFVPVDGYATVTGIEVIPE